MDDYDRQNLNFLLNITPEVLQDWYDLMDEDDHEYASELLAAYKEELDLKRTFYEIEEINLESTSDAAEYLSKFRKK
jgi:hypothetical protein